MNHKHVLAGTLGWTGMLLLSASAAMAAEITFSRPAPGEPVYGDVEVVISVRPQNAPLQRIDVFLDRKRVGSLDRPPYRLLANAGLDNAEHRFEALAYLDNKVVASTSILTPRIAVDEEIKVELRQIFASIGRRDGSVPALTKEDFVLSDLGSRQEIASFERGDVRFTAALLVDASVSMQGGRLEAALDAAGTFVSSLRSLDEAKLVLFSDRVQGETPFTNLPTVLSLGLSGVRAEGGTALSDALFLTLKRLEERRGRKVVVLLSDGIDIESVVPMKEVDRLARRIQASIYWLRLRKPSDIENAKAPVSRFSIWRDAVGHKRELEALAEVVRDSGGRIQPIDHIDQVKGVLAGLLDELRSQYILGYYPTVTRGPGTWHEVDIRVRGSGYVVRAQKGYSEG